MCYTDPETPIALPEPQHFYIKTAFLFILVLLVHVCACPCFSEIER